MVQVALAETVTEAEEIEAILREAGIEVELETAVDHHPSETDDAPREGARPASPSSRPRRTRSRR